MTSKLQPNLEESYFNIFDTIEKIHPLRDVTPEYIVSKLLGREILNYREVSELDIQTIMSKWKNFMGVTAELLKRLLDQDLLFCDNCKFSIELDEFFNSDKNCTFKLIVQRT